MVLNRRKRTHPGLKFIPGIFELDELELGLAPVVHERWIALSSG